MKSLLALVLLSVFAISFAPVAPAHEMFLKSEGHELAENSEQVIRLLNGTFDISENAVSRDRMRDVSLVAHGKREHPPASEWYDDEDGSASYLKYRSAAAGTYALGVSTKPSLIALKRDDFIAYLKHDGVIDVLAEFEKGAGPDVVRERYSKHVKALVQVGKERTGDHAAVLGYPVEIVPDTNPYDLRFGQELGFRVLVDGKPAANLPVRVGYEGFHGHDESGEHISHYALRTDADGRAKFLLSNKAIWYISLIHMKEVDEPEVDYESNWATLTFSVK